jgi:hypothetical protein
LSIQFRTADRAAEAGLALKTARVGVVSHLGDTGIVCELNPDVTHANVLSILQVQTEDIVSLQESETPLHAILANVYKDKRGSRD